MREDVGAVLDSRAPGPGGLSRVVKWSFAVHLGVAVSVIAWQAYLARAAERATPMTISLSGPVGPSTGGLNPLGGRQVDVATPPPKRPDPPVAPPKPAEMVVPTKSVAKPVTPTRDSSVSQSSVVTPMATGRRVETGSSVVETGARGESSGLAQGGGGTGAKADVDPAFLLCCSEYIAQMQTAISQQVTWAQQFHGAVVIKFEIRRDGTIDLANMKVDTSSGFPPLDTDALHAIRVSRLPHLPPAYKDNSLIVYLKFPY